MFWTRIFSDKFDQHDQVLRFLYIILFLDAYFRKTKKFKIILYELKLGKCWVTFEYSFDRAFDNYNNPKIELCCILITEEKTKPFAKEV